MTVGYGTAWVDHVRDGSRLGVIDEIYVEPERPRGRGGGDARRTPGRVLPGRGLFGHRRHRAARPPASEELLRARRFHCPVVGHAPVGASQRPALCRRATGEPGRFPSHDRDRPHRRRDPSGISAPLLPAPDDAGLEQLLDAADAKADELAKSHGRVERVRRRRARRVHAGSGRGARPARPGGQLRRPRLRGRHQRSGARRADDEGRRAHRGDRHEAAVLRARVGRARATSESKSCWPTPALAFAAHHLRSARRYRPHLLSEPEEVVLTEKSVTGRSAWERLFDELVSAIEVTLDGEPTTLERGLSRLNAPDRSERQAAAAAVTDGARTRSADACVRAQHAARRQVDRRPPAAFRVVDREPEPVERGERRVGRGTRVGGAGPVLDPAALVHAEGAAARPRPPRRLRPHGVDRRGRERGRLGRGQGPRARRVRVVLAGARRQRPQLLRQSVDRRTGTTGQATRRVLRLHGAVASSVPVAQLDGAPPRRAHARARARARPARVPRARAGRVPPDDAADARRDRVGVRRDGDVRPSARDGVGSGRTAHAARRQSRGPDRDGVPPDRDEPLRARDAHRASRGRGAVDRPARRAVGRHARPRCSATRWRSPRATARGGRTSRTSSARPATCTRTRTASCSRCRCTRGTRRRGVASSRATSTCCARAARSHPRSSARSSASTSPTPASGTAASTSSNAGSRRPSKPRRPPGRLA